MADNSAALERTCDNLRTFVGSRKAAEAAFVDLYFGTGEAYVAMKQAVSDGMGGHTIMPAPRMRIHYSPIRNIKDDISHEDVAVMQKTLMKLNPCLAASKKTCVAAANADPAAGNAYAWHTGNGYARSVVLKFPQFAEYCATGRSTLAAPRTRRLQAKPAEALVLSNLPHPTTVASPYFLAAPSPQPIEATVAVLPTKGDEAAERRKPPSRSIQQLRTAGMCCPLLSYLKKRGKFTSAGPPQWRAISDWTKTPEGMQWIRDADIDPLGVQLDHINARNGVGAGQDSVFNCYFLPPAANAWFGEFNTREKAAYLGDHAIDLAKRYGAWMRAKVQTAQKNNPELFDQSAFDPHIL